jgi:hypothetical protein
MATKIEGLEVVQRDSVRGSAEYLYKGVRISKYTQERGHKTRIRGGYSRAGVKFTFKVNNFNAHAIIATSYRISKNYTLKETIAEINDYLSRSNIMADNGEIIVGVAEREMFRKTGVYNG